MVWRFEAAPVLWWFGLRNRPTVGDIAVLECRYLAGRALEKFPMVETMTKPGIGGRRDSPRFGLLGLKPDGGGR